MKDRLFIELHVLQSFAPSNLNRDDVGSPKSCMFGGVPRARISSQCLKRTAREFVRDEGLLETQDLAERSRRLTSEIAGRLGKGGRDLGAAQKVAVNALRGVGLTVDEDNRTQYLLYIGERAIEGLTDVCNRFWDDLVELDGVPSEPSAAPSRGRQAKREGASDISDEVKRAVRSVIAGDKAADLAMFGRMLADLPDLNVDAACQVAHAISTHEVRSELDYWTAVDDLNPDDTAGAGMIGAMEFNSACYYRYLNIDVGQLLNPRNLDGDRDLAIATVNAFLQASLLSTPKGKQSGTAALSPIAFAMTVVRTANPLSLVNAFEAPVRATNGSGVVQGSIERLERHYQAITSGYGEYAGVRRRIAWTENVEGVPVPQEDGTDTLSQLVHETVETAFAPHQAP